MLLFDDDWLDSLLAEGGLSELQQHFILIGVCFFLPLLLGVVLGFFLAGSRQRAQSNGSQRRLLLASLFGTAATFLPASVSLVIVWIAGITPTDLATFFGFALTVIAATHVAVYFKPTVGIAGHLAPQIRVEDELFLNRVQELAGKMHVAAPGIRLLRSPTPDQNVMAYVFGLPAPMILIEDGLMHRLDADERDAIVCHELGHIANASLWGLALLIPLASTGAMIALLSGVATWYLMIPALFVGLHRLLMRPMELDCDLRAARAMGFPEMATALQKIHRLAEGNASPWLWKLIRATCTHPSLPTRLAWLRKHAPPDQLERMPAVPQESKLLTWLMAGGWVLGVAGAWWLGRLESWWAIGTSGALLVMVATTPWLLLQGSSSIAKLRNRFVIAWKRDGWLWIGMSVAVAVIAVAWHQLMLPFPEEPSAGLVGGLSMSIMIGLAALLALMIQKSQRKTVDHEMQAAWEDRDFEYVLVLSRRHSRHVRKNPQLRHLRAGALAILGNRPQAIVEFEELIADDPNTEQHYISLASVLIDDGSPEKVLPVAQAAMERFPNGMGNALASRALRRLGRLDEALEHAESAMKLHPEQGAIWAATAGIASDQGDFVRATELLRIASEKTPGSPQELIEGARLAIHTESRDKAIEKLERALAMLRDNPMMMRQSDAAILRKELAELNRVQV